MVDMLLNLTRLKGMSLYRKQAGVSGSAAVTHFSFTDAVRSDADPRVILHGCGLFRFFTLQAPANNICRSSHITAHNLTLGQYRTDHMCWLLQLKDRFLMRLLPLAFAQFLPGLYKRSASHFCFFLKMLPAPYCMTWIQA